MELVTRSEARGWGFVSRAGGGGVVVVVVVVMEGTGWGSWAAWSHAARADGSTGHAEGGGLLGDWALGEGVAWTLLEELVLPIVGGEWVGNFLRRYRERTKAESEVSPKGEFC